MAQSKLSPFGQKLGAPEDSQFLSEQVFFDLHDPRVGIRTIEEYAMEPLQARNTIPFKPMGTGQQQELSRLPLTILFSQAANDNGVNWPTSGDPERFGHRTD